MFLKFLVFSYFDWHISGKNWKNLYFFGVVGVLKLIGCASVQKSLTTTSSPLAAGVFAGSNREYTLDFL